jgi:tRNA pseudouridine38-40 synthase
MPRYKVTIEYDGGPFVGWQRQANGMSVQQALEEAVAAFTGETVVIKGAGRTDSGVHALGQVAHFDLATERTTDVVRDAVNAHLRPHPVAILSAERVGEDFDARFSATRRHYVYRLSDRRAPAVIHRGRVWWVGGQALDAAAMHESAQALVGNHDFTTFRSAECQAKSPVRTLDRLDVAREQDEIVVRADARSFLHNQVRSMVGALKRVGEGKWPVSAVGEALEARDRSRSGPVAPPHGLYLVQVDY